MAVTTDSVVETFNAKYRLLAGANAAVTVVKDTTFKAAHKGKQVEFDIPAATSNMQLMGLVEPAANSLWRLVK